MFFGSGRPRPEVESNYYGIHEMAKTDTGWSKPVFFKPGMYATTSINGNFYVTHITDTSHGGIVVSKFENGIYSANSLSFNDLMGRWQDSEAVFKFRHGDNFFQVTFSIPKLENGTSKFATLIEAWEEGELYQKVEGL